MKLVKMFLLLMILPAALEAFSLQTGGSYTVHFISCALDSTLSIQDEHRLQAGITLDPFTWLSAGASILYSKTHPAPYDGHVVLRGYTAAGLKAYLDVLPASGPRRSGVTLFGSGLFAYYAHTPLLFFFTEAGAGLFLELEDILIDSLSLRLAVTGTRTIRRDVASQTGIGAEAALVYRISGRSNE